MHLNHLNLVTAELADAARFFQRFFGFRLDVVKGGDAFATLTGENGFVLNLMKPAKAEPAIYPESFHIGFFVADAAEVHARHAELAGAGCMPGDVRQFVRGGRTMTSFYCRIPGGVLLEVAST